MGWGQMSEATHEEIGQAWTCLKDCRDRVKLLKEKVAGMAGLMLWRRLGYRELIAPNGRPSGAREMVL